MYAKANKHKNMYLTLANAVNLSSCFLYQNIKIEKHNTKLTTFFQKLFLNIFN